MKNCIEVITTENTTTYVRTSSITAVEQTPSTSRAEGYTKIYIPGFEIRTKQPIEEILAEIERD